MTNSHSPSSAESAGRRCDGGMNPWPCPTCGDGACHFPEKPAPSRDPRCDCQQPEEINGMRGISNSCPVHNDCPDPPWPDSAVTATVAQAERVWHRKDCPFCGSPDGHYSASVGELSAAFFCKGCGINQPAQPPAAPVDLTDPVVVHANMLRGTIAKPTWEQIKHLYPEHFQSSAVSAEDIARTIALSYGRDPDALTEWTEMCDEDNQPVPVWMVYLEQAAAVLVEYSVSRTTTEPQTAAWQSMATAPKDGPAFLVWVPENLCIYEVIARGDGNLSIFGGGFRDNLHRATHWMPLPASPLTRPHRVSESAPDASTPAQRLPE